MGKEIERKYLVRNDAYRALSTAQLRIAQGYLSANPEAVVRIRIANDQAYITVKSKNHGATRGEWEYSIPVADAEQMLALCQHVLSKTRYIVPYQGYKWEVDEFHGSLSGLVMAEIELPDEGAAFDLPGFVGQEVTGNPEYYNSNLAQHALQ